MANKALNNIRNTVAQHILIDYRIAAAMINFTHKPITADGNESALVAKRIRKKANQIYQENDLSFLLNKQLDTSLMAPIKLSSLNDFPRLKLNEITQKILFGTYQMKLAKSYIDELIKNEKNAFILADRIINQIENFELKSELQRNETKIIGIEIISRHRRGIDKKKSKLESLKFRNNYKLFIQYVPGMNGHKNIKSKVNEINLDCRYIFISDPFSGYVCSCKNGQRIAGACVHIASLIYYMGNLRNRVFKSPGIHLNSALIDIRTRQLPNRPNHVRNTRRNTMPPTSESELSDESSEEETDSYFNRFKKKYKIAKKGSKSEVALKDIDLPEVPSNNRELSFDGLESSDSNDSEVTLIRKYINRQLKKMPFSNVTNQLDEIGLSHVVDSDNDSASEVEST